MATPAPTRPADDARQHARAAHVSPDRLLASTTRVAARHSYDVSQKFIRSDLTSLFFCSPHSKRQLSRPSWFLSARSRLCRHAKDRNVSVIDQQQHARRLQWRAALPKRPLVSDLKPSLMSGSRQPLPLDCGAAFEPARKVVEFGAALRS
jgi:hypothetical protein